jgi:hypothetical protein
MYIFLKFSHNIIWENFDLNYMSHHYFAPWGFLEMMDTDILLFFGLQVLMEQ